jgi:hypothetical protein
MATSVIQHVDDLFVAASGSAPSVEAASPVQGGHDELDRFIDREIAARMRKNVSWKQLDTCFKWARVLEYLQENGVGSQDPMIGELREMLKLNKLSQVQYDSHTHKITKLNMGDL